MTEQMITEGMTYDDALTWIESLDFNPEDHQIIDGLLDQIDPVEAAYHRSDIDFWRGFAACSRSENLRTAGKNMNSREWWRGFAWHSQLRQLVSNEAI